MATYPAYIHMISSTALVAMSGNEICGLVATYMGTKCLATRSTQPSNQHAREGRWALKHRRGFCGVEV